MRIKKSNNINTIIRITTMIIMMIIKIIMIYLHAEVSTGL